MTQEEYINQHPEQFKDDIDKWLFIEFGIIGGCCSAEKSHEYAVARMVAERYKNSLWKPASGDNLPEIDKEVIVLQGIKNPVTTDSMWGCEVAFAHRPNPNGWDGKSITTGKVEHYDVQTYGKGGWNIPDVKYWLDCELPKMEE